MISVRLEIICCHIKSKEMLDGDGKMFKVLFKICNESSIIQIVKNSALLTEFFFSMCSHVVQMWCHCKD